MQLFLSVGRTGERSNFASVAADLNKTKVFTTCVKEWLDLYGFDGLERESESFLHKATFQLI